MLAGLLFEYIFKIYIKSSSKQLIISISQLFIINVINLINIEHASHINTNAKNLIVQWAIEPASPLNFDLPTMPNANLNAMSPMIVIAI